MEKIWASVAEFVGTALRNLAKQGVLVCVLAGGIVGVWALMDKQNQGLQAHIYALQSDVEALQKKWLDCETSRYEQAVEVARLGERMRAMQAQIDAQATARRSR